MKFKIENRKLRIFIFLFGTWFVIFGLLGCEAFVRKFTRKPKKRMPEVEMVLAPQEYTSLFSDKEEEYRQYFLYWQSWQDEFINALLYAKSHKKQMSCLDEAIKNLTQVKSLLIADKQKDLDSYIKQLCDLKNELSKDTYTTNANLYRNRAEKIKRGILKSYCYRKAKDYLK